MTMNNPSFHSINRISNWLVNWSIASIIITIIYLASSYAFLYLSTNLEHNNPFFINFIVGLITLVISFVTAIIALYWFYRANKNIHAFGAKEVSSARMAVIWFFVPILQLWKPYEVAQQIWKASNPRIVISNGTEWKNSSSSNFIKVWWILGLLDIFMGIFVGIFLPPANAQLLFEPTYREEPLPFYEDFRMISTGIPGIVSTIFFILTIRRISAWQEIKAGKSI